MRNEMQRNLSAAVAGPVTVKGNRAEQLGALGRGEGVACFASALIHRTVSPS
jgi:2C-methyl-D-erythritol 2,4-cyclodiphosphate synthase